MESQKHAMLYPDPNNITEAERNLATEALGLPREPPPSYLAAISLTNIHQSVESTIDEALPSNVEHAPNENPTTSTEMPPTQQQQQQQHTITIQQLSGQKLGPNPSSIMCPICNNFRTTRMTHTPNMRTHVTALVLCVLGWCCCACLIPYCMNSCRTGNHYCSQCNTYLGTYDPKIIG